MTPKERAVIQQVLEALEQYHYTLISAGVLDKQHVLNQGFTAHAALQEALAEQAEQEPVAWRCIYDHAAIRIIEPEEFFKRSWEPLYAAPQPVCRSELKDAFQEGFNRAADIYAPQNVSQEPVAWMHKCGDVCSAYDKEHMFGLDYFNIPLYTAPQPVKEVELTDEEILQCGGMDAADNWAFDFARAVIAAYKEKNK